MFFLSMWGSLPALADYALELQVSDRLADSIMQALLRDHMQIPAVLSFMLFAVLWAPVIESKLSKG